MQLLLTFIIAHAVAAQGATPSFPDVPPSAPYAHAIEYLRGTDIIAGYNDGTFRPERTVNRAEFMKILVKLLLDQTEIDACTSRDRSHFRDVPQGSWFAPYVCAAKQRGMIDGYKNPSDTSQAGNTFHPANTINIAEASSILARAFHLELPPDDPEPWYSAPIRALSDAHAIPPDVQAAGEALTRGVLAEMLWRLQEKITDQPTAESASILATTCAWVDDSIPGVDVQEVRRVWVSWLNSVRAALNIAPLTQSKQLNRTATMWSESARNAGGITHKRPGYTAYYDYRGIESWFASLDIQFENVKSTTFTENIGWGVFQCNRDDCTQDLLSAMRSTFDFYMSEKGKPSAPHYNSMVQRQFRLIGTGIVVDKAAGRYYLTTHYGTAITSNPDPVCP